MLLEQQDRQTYAEMQVAAAFMAAGAKGVEMPSITSARSAFDAVLNAEPQNVPSRVFVIREALGLRRAG